jgi:hypothetical protein
MRQVAAVKKSRDSRAERVSDNLSSGVSAGIIPIPYANPYADRYAAELIPDTDLIHNL